MDHRINSLASNNCNVVHCPLDAVVTSLESLGRRNSGRLKTIGKCESFLWLSLTALVKAAIGILKWDRASNQFYTLVYFVIFLKAWMRVGALIFAIFITFVL